MPFTVEHDPGRDIVSVNLTATITAGDLARSAERCYALQKQTGCLRYLIDSDSWDLQASTVDIHAFPDRGYADAQLDRRTRIAVVQPGNEKARQAARFYEDACRNRGWNARILPDREAALAWLEGR